MRESDRITLLVVLGLMGGVLGFLFGDRIGGPSHSDIRQEAHAFVPEGAVITEDTEATGDPFVSGPYAAAVGFKSSHPVDSEVAELAELSGWSTISRLHSVAGTTMKFEKGALEARVSMFVDPYADSDSPNEVSVQKREEWTSTLRMGVTIGGFILGICLAVLISNRARRHQVRML
jgi:hypothetical protein